MTLFEIFGGDLDTDRRNNILKSLTINELKNGCVSIEAEPYDDAYNTEKMDETTTKICNLLDRREKSIFKALRRYYGVDVDTISITFFDAWTTYGGCTKYLGEKAMMSFA